MITSILDNDFYKFTMMHAVDQKFPDAIAHYRFINRNTQNTFSPQFLNSLQEKINALAHLKLSDEEFHWFNNLKLLPTPFLEKLKTFQLNPSLISLKLNSDNQITLDIHGSWFDTILFEVPLLALISETYFENTPTDLEDYYNRTLEKGKKLSQANCKFVDYGTRRRRNFATQKTTIKAFSNLGPTGSYLGTSNVLLSKEFNTIPLGTMAHEWIMAHGGLFGVPNANTIALNNWLDVFEGNFSIALTDTYSTDTFFKEFTPKLAQAFSGIRQDSGNPLNFIDKAINFYNSQSINPLDKNIIFSDSLNVDKAIEIQTYAQNKINPTFGIGTHFTNDFPENPPLNIVLKLAHINNTPVYKTTDTPDKQCFV